MGAGGGGYGSVGQTGSTTVSLGVSVEMGPMGRRAAELAVSSRGQVSSNFEIEVLVVPFFRFINSSMRGFRFLNMTFLTLKTNLDAFNHGPITH